MPANTFGELFRVTTFGESHGAGLGGIIDGCPPGLPLCEADMQRALDLRKPGSGPTATKRKESDTVEILSGVFEGKTTGTPIAFLVRNQNQRSSDYEDLRRVFRPGHADWGFYSKFGIRDHRGGGRSSGRETIGRVAAGAVADILLGTLGIRVLAATVELGGIPAEGLDLDGALHRPYFAASDEAPAKWDERVREARASADTLGGIVRIEARGVPAGLGEPVFGKLDAELAFALMGVGNNDPMLEGGKFASNHAGGILGGISSGQDIIVKAAVKPIASIPQEQRTIDIDGKPVSITIGGRHDLSAIPRCVPVHRAMVSLVLADAVLLQRRLGRGL